MTVSGTFVWAQIFLPVHINVMAARSRGVKGLERDGCGDSRLQTARLRQMSSPSSFHLLLEAAGTPADVLLAHRPPH